MKEAEKPSESATQRRKSKEGWDERAVVWFPSWGEALAAAPMTTEVRTAYRRALLGFLHHCKLGRCLVTIAVAKTYLATPSVQAHPAEPVREALRWFFRRARETKGLGVSENRSAPAAQRREHHDHRVPPPAAQDRGTTDWEVALIRELRVRGLLWRTEQTYRAWSRRFALG